MLTESDIQVYVSKDIALKDLNKRRRRNFVIYHNDIMNLAYDIKSDFLRVESTIPFSIIEHDTNRRWAQIVCNELMFNYTRVKDKYIDYLTNNRHRKYKPKYMKYISILNGEIDFDDEDVCVLISILGRLHQERCMGPISVMKDEKLNPDLVTRHTATKKYIVSYVKTVKEYSNLYLSNRDQMKQLGNINFNGVLDRFDYIPNPIPLLSYKGETSTSVVEAEFKLKGNVYSHNYIESFFRKLINLNMFKKIPFSIDNYKDIIEDIIDYGQRFIGRRDHEVVILEKVKSILMFEDFDNLMRIVDKKIYNISKRRTYYKDVSKHLLNIKDKILQRQEFYKLLLVYENHVVSDLHTFIEDKKQYANSEFTDCEISIESDMHFNNVDNINKGNYSKNFNIIAGDFYNNAFHRGRTEIKDSFNIKGIGVLGNHDVNWQDNISDVEKEVNSNYAKSIEIMKKLFPNVKILNNEVYYKNGIAFVGVTIVSDENNSGKRSFFANSNLGYIFKPENYIDITRKLLDSIDSQTPTVVITHSPFKEYSVCKNKNIGVFSNDVFKDYPNVKMYIHGHGHSGNESKVIENVLCVTNPIFNNVYTESLQTFKWIDLVNSNVILLG